MSDPLTLSEQAKIVEHVERANANGGNAWINIDSHTGEWSIHTPRVVIHPRTLLDIIRGNTSNFS
jgi:hypothetical protein